jgi:glycerol-3-phosphate acyltransferase PlsY
VIYRIDDPGRLVEERVVTVDGRPVAIAVSGALAYILERPAGDARHIEPGFWQCLDLTTGALGPRARVGWDPDDLALLPGGRHVAVLLSGHAEGESNRPPPSLEIFELSSDPALPARIASLPFEQPGEDPARLTLSRTGQAAVVTIRGTNMSASIDLTDPTSPRLLGRFPLPALEVDYLSYDSTASSTDEILMPVASEQDAVLFRPAAEIPGEWVLSAREADSAVWVYPTRDRRALGRLPLRGAMNFGEVRPTAIAVEPRRGYFAVASRSGAVHLVALRATSPDASSSVALARDEPSHDHSRR